MCDEVFYEKYNLFLKKEPLKKRVYQGNQGPRESVLASIGSVATLPAKYLTRRTCRAGDFLFGESPNPLYQITTIERM